MLIELPAMDEPAQRGNLIMSQHLALSAEEIIRRGREIYDRDIRPTVEPSRNGEFVVIDVLTGAFEVADDDLTASDRILEKVPNAITYGIRVGAPAAYRMGGYRRVAGEL